METVSLSVARWIARSRVNGPGERFVLWVQGCSLHCVGCWNPDTWEQRLPNTTVEEILREIDDTPGIEGVTFTGGEPFDQAEALAVLARACHLRGLSVFVFTGYELSELRSPAQRALLELVAVAVTGRYEARKRTVQFPWRGSHNQRVHFLTDRYSEHDLPRGSESEVHLASDGSIVVTGFPEAALLRL